MGATLWDGRRNANAAVSKELAGQILNQLQGQYEHVRANAGIVREQTLHSSSQGSLSLTNHAVRSLSCVCPNAKKWYLSPTSGWVKPSIIT